MYQQQHNPNSYKSPEVFFFKAEISYLYQFHRGQISKKKMELFFPPLNKGPVLTWLSFQANWTRFPSDLCKGSFFCKVCKWDINQKVIQLIQTNPSKSKPGKKSWHHTISNRKCLKRNFMYFLSLLIMPPAQGHLTHLAVIKALSSLNPQSDCSLRNIGIEIHTKKERECSIRSTFPNQMSCKECRGFGQFSQSTTLCYPSKTALQFCLFTISLPRVI